MPGLRPYHIAVLGSSSHIACGIIYHLLQRHDYQVYLFTQSSGKVQQFVASLGCETAGNYQIIAGYETFSSYHFDAIINCVGVGKTMHNDYTLWFTVTEEFDKLVIDYLLRAKHDPLYISISSGAVYGNDHQLPVTQESVHSVAVNALTSDHYYGIVRLNAEAKHRAFAHLNIVDLRVFSYFSRFMELAGGFFIADVVHCALTHQLLLTDHIDIVRDYVHPEDLYSLIEICMAKKKLNLALDVFSVQPVAKFSILQYFADNYGLKYEMRASTNNLRPTGRKNIYYTQNYQAKEYGYMPKYSSLESIIREY